MLHGGGDKDEDQQQPMQLEPYCYCHGGGDEGGNSGGANVNKLLMECARAMDRRQWHQAAAFLAQAIRSPGSSPMGDSSERLAHYLARALARNLPGSLLPLLDDGGEGSSSSSPMASASSIEDGGTGAAYLALNQVTPFVRFAHLSANQAILEAVEGKQVVHIVDLGMVHGLQWPPLMQALVERRRQQQQQLDGPSLLRLRITGTGPSAVELEQTGWRLRDFATSLGLEFEFDAVSVPRRHLLMPPPQDRLWLGTGNDEALVVNSMMLLHEYQGGSGGDTVAVARHGDCRQG